MSTEYDVIISGASVAGCTAATLYARQGARVALIERRRDLNTHKVLCTHYIQPCAYPVLQELGIAGELEKVGAVRNEARWYTRWGWIEPRPAPGEAPLPFGYNIRRRTLDPILRKMAAQTPGVDLLLGTEVMELLRDGDRVVGVKTYGPDGVVERRAKLVVGADGKDSAVAKLAGVKSKTVENERFSYFAHFRNLPLAGGVTQSWFLEPDVAYAMPNDDGVTVVAILPTKEKLPAFRDDLEGSYLNFIRHLPDAPPIDQAERITKITGTVNYPLVVRKPTAAGVALIGDAALTSDPLWGVGCGWAFQSASWLVEATGASVRRGGQKEVDMAVRGYAKRHRAGLRGHQHLIGDYANGRAFNPFERLMFSAAARDDVTARHMHLFASRLIGATTFLSLPAMSRAIKVNLAHRRMARSSATRGATAVITSGTPTTLAAPPLSPHSSTSREPALASVSILPVNEYE